MEPLVSVIVPCYNRSETIELCLRSVIGQTYTPIEIIVVDDCGTDDSGVIAESMGATVLRLPTNQGPSAARNLGADHARGDILFFLDADVALEPGSVAAAVEALRSSPGLGAICGVLRPESLRSRTLVAQYRALQMYHWWLVREGPITGLHTALCAMRADVFREIGPFDPGLRHTEAPEYGWRLSQRYEVRSTAAIAGVHDHDSTLRVLLPKVFQRAYTSAFEWRAGGGPSGSPARVLASVLILAAALSWPLPLLTGAAGAAVPAVLLAAAVVCDSGTYRRVVASHGLGFGLRFTAVHLLYQLTTATGGAIGTARRLAARGAWRVAAMLLPAALTATVLLMVLTWARGDLADTQAVADVQQRFASFPGDLSIYREAGARVLAGASPYDFDHSGYPFVYPPFAALLMAPLGSLGLDTVYWLWTAMSVLCLQGLVWLTLDRVGVHEPARRRRLVLAGTLAALPLSPVIGTLLLGNVNVLLVLLVLVDLLWTRRGYRGVLIGIAAGIKLTPLIFVPYLLLTGRVRAAVIASLSFLGTVGLGFLLLPAPSLSFWGGAFLDSDRTRPPGEEAYGSSVRGVWVNVLPGSWEPGWMVASVAVAAMGLAVAVWASRRGEELLAIVLCGVTGLLVSPVTWYTHWIWCVPVLALVAALVRRGWRPARALFAGLWLVFAIPLPWWTVWVLGWVDMSPRDWVLPTELLYLVMGAALLVLATAWLRGAGSARLLPEASKGLG